MSWLENKIAAANQYTKHGSVHSEASDTTSTTSFDSPSAACMYLSMYLYMLIFMLKCAYMYVCLYVCIYLSMYVNLYVYIHILH